MIPSVGMSFFADTGGAQAQLQSFSTFLSSYVKQISNIANDVTGLSIPVDVIASYTETAQRTAALGRGVVTSGKQDIKVAQAEYKNAVNAYNALEKASDKTTKAMIRDVSNTDKHYNKLIVDIEKINTAYTTSTGPDEFAQRWKKLSAEMPKVGQMLKNSIPDLKNFTEMIKLHSSAMHSVSERTSDLARGMTALGKAAAALAVKGQDLQNSFIPKKADLTKEMKASISNLKGSLTRLKNDMDFVSDSGKRAFDRKTVDDFQKRINNLSSKFLELREVAGSQAKGLFSNMYGVIKNAQTYLEKNSIAVSQLERQKKAMEKLKDFEQKRNAAFEGVSGAITDNKQKIEGYYSKVKNLSNVIIEIQNSWMKSGVLTIQQKDALIRMVAPLAQLRAEISTLTMPEVFKRDILYAINGIDKLSKEMIGLSNSSEMLNSAERKLATTNQRVVSEMKSIEGAAQKDINSFQGMANSAKKLQEGIDKIRAPQKGFWGFMQFLGGKGEGGDVGENIRKFGLVGEGVNQVREHFVKAGGGVSAFSDLIGKASIVGTVAVAGFKALASAAGFVAGKIYDISKSILMLPFNIIHKARQMFVKWYVTVLLAFHMFSRLTKDVGEFQKAVLRASSISSEKFSNFNSIMKTSMDLMAKYPVTMEQLGSSMVKISQAGYVGEDLNKMIVPATQLAVIFGGEMEPAIDALISTMKAFDLPAEQASDVMLKMANVAMKTNLSLEDLATAIGYAAPAAESLGVSLTDTLVILGKFKDIGLSASRVGTAMREGFSRLAGVMAETANKTPEDALNMLGISIKDLQGTEGDLLKLHEVFNNAFSRTTDEVRRGAMMILFGKRSYAAWDNMLRSSTDEIIRRREEIAQLNTLEEKSNEIANRGFNVMQRLYNVYSIFRLAVLQGMDVPFKKMGDSIGMVSERLQEFGTTIGQAISPIISKLVDWISSAIEDTDLEKYFSNIYKSIIVPMIEYISRIAEAIKNMAKEFVGSSDGAGLLSGIISIIGESILASIEYSGIFIKKLVDFSKSGTLQKIAGYIAMLPDLIDYVINKSTLVSSIWNGVVWVLKWVGKAILIIVNIVNLLIVQFRMVWNTVELVYNVLVDIVDAVAWLFGYSDKPLFSRSAESIEYYKTIAKEGWDVAKSTGEAWKALDQLGDSAYSNTKQKVSDLSNLNKEIQKTADVSKNAGNSIIDSSSDVNINTELDINVNSDANAEEVARVASNAYKDIVGKQNDEVAKAVYKAASDARFRASAEGVATIMGEG